MSQTQQATPGWYPDPSDARQLRWYDGTQWTSAVHTAPTTTPSAAMGVPTARPATASTAAPTAPFAAAATPTLPANGCQVCGATPAMAVHLRGHQGMLIMMRFLTYKGRFCRDCGTALFRTVQRRTMLVGWWGYLSVFINTGTVLWNTAVYSKIRSLGTPVGRARAGAKPVESVFVSPGFAVVVLLAVVAVFVAVH